MKFAPIKNQFTLVKTTSLQWFRAPVHGAWLPGTSSLEPPLTSCGVLGRFPKYICLILIIFKR